MWADRHALRFGFVRTLLLVFMIIQAGTGSACFAFFISLTFRGEDFRAATRGGPARLFLSQPVGARQGQQLLKYPGRGPPDHRPPVLERPRPAHPPPVRIRIRGQGGKQRQ